MVRADPRRRLYLSPPWRIACTVLNILPLPGVGAILAGWRNPHTGLRGRGVAQLLLVLFGGWPLIIPGVIGFVWAVFTAVHIFQEARPLPPWSRDVGIPK